MITMRGTLVELFSVMVGIDVGVVVCLARGTCARRGVGGQVRYLNRYRGYGPFYTCVCPPQTSRVACGKRIVPNGYSVFFARQQSAAQTSCLSPRSPTLRR